MSTNTNTNKTRKTNTAAAVVNAIADNTKAPNMEQNKTREKLGYEAAQNNPWKTTPIVSYIKTIDDGTDLLTALDIEMEAEAKTIPNGRNSVVMLGCEHIKNADTGVEFLRLTIKDVVNGAIKDVSLFPGNKYTDKMGAVHNAGHNWKALKDEVYAQRNKLGIGMKPMGFIDFIKSELTKGFDTWILFDGKYTNMYVNENKYNYAVKELAKKRQAGDKGESKAPWEE